MKLYFGARVVSADGRAVGLLQEVVVHPADRQVTHLVVQKGLLFHADTLLPATAVAASSQQQIRLGLDAAAIVPHTGEFRPHEFIVVDEEPAAPDRPLGGAVWTAPPQAPPLPQLPPNLIPPGVAPAPMEEAVAIPAEAVLLDPGAPVEDADGTTVGRVAEVVTDERQQITHLRAFTGHVFRDPKLIPVHWIGRIEHNRVVLVVARRLVDKLPVVRD